MAILSLSASALRVGLVVSLFAVTTMACDTARIAIRGNLPNAERLAEVTPGDMSREEVAEVLGSPSSVTPFNSDLWLYISEKTSTIAFLAPEVLERNVVMVSFDQEGMVREVKKLDLSNAQDVAHVERVTPTSGNEVTIWDQLFSNLGRFNNPAGLQ